MIPQCTDFSLKSGNLVEPSLKIQATQVKTVDRTRGLYIGCQLWQLNETLSQMKSKRNIAKWYLPSIQEAFSRFMTEKIYLFLLVHVFWINAE